MVEIRIYNDGKIGCKNNSDSKDSQGKGSVIVSVILNCGGEWMIVPAKEMRQ